ncbi:ATP-binding protein [uncultured Fibrella sp.]|uniref:ATP-binding protein n=1 Tax=uncultured Fibrella sp. TaxID=1284596 RepID=UPI0035CBAF79
MATGPTINFSLTDLLDALPDGVVWSKAVYDDFEQVVDFQVTYVNGTARQMTASIHEVRPGMLWRETLATYLPAEPDSFEAMSAVLATGTPDEYSFQNEAQHIWYTIRRSRLHGGILSVVRDVSSLQYTRQQADQQNALVATMLDGAINGVLLLEPVYELDQLVDFEIVAANKSIRMLTGVEAGKATGQLMSTTYPGYKLGGFFDLYKRVLQDGQPGREEYWYDDGRLKGWFEVSVVRQEQQIVLTFTNTTNVRTAILTAQQAAERLQAVIDHSQTGIFVFSPVFDESGEQIVDFRFKTINRMVAALVGQTPDKLTGAVASDWFISYRETGLFDKYKRTYLTGEPQRFDINYNVDGFDVWFDVQSVRVESDVLVTFTDYTLLKQAQQAIEQQAIQTRKQTELLNGVLDGSESGIIAFEAIRDPDRQQGIIDFRVMVANKASESILKLSVEAMEGKKLYDIFPGNWKTGLFDLYVQTTETGQPGHTEVYYNHDGLDCWLSVSVQQLGDGFVVTFSDISALKRANRAVEEAADELITVIDTSQTGIFLFLPLRNEQGEVVDFRFKVANKQLARYIGKDVSEVTGGLGSNLFPDYMTNGLFNKYRETYLTGRTNRFDFHYYGSGIDAWLDIMSTKMGDAVLVTFTDYTALKKLQQQLENTIADLKRSNANLEQFAYVASHDLQEPLRKIQSFGDVLQNSFGNQLGEEGSGLIGRMQTAANRMAGLIRDLLAYSRLTTHPDANQAVSLQMVLSRVLDDLELTIQETGTVVHTGHLPTVIGDEMQLRQLLQNLVSNAIKFRLPDGHPVVQISSSRLAANELPADVHPLQQAPHYERIDLTDNGIGFDQKYNDRIFQVFQRLHGRSQYEGTGIGLAIVQRVVDNHGGAVTASSEPGKGATFTIYLPAIN